MCDFCEPHYPDTISVDADNYQELSYKADILDNCVSYIADLIKDNKDDIDDLKGLIEEIESVIRSARNEVK